MFSLAVVDTDKFIDMPISARLLYYELGMRADDDGFVSSAKKIVRMVGCSEDDLKLLITKGFVICFESGIIVITHWKMHNYIPKDRYHKTIFQDEHAKLMQKNDVYMLSDNSCIQDVYNTDTECIQDDDKLYTEVKLSKDKLNKDNTMSTAVDGGNSFDYEAVVNSFNSVCVSLPKVKTLNDKRKRQIKSAYKLLGDVSFEEYFNMIESSDFLTGRNEKWANCGFDWCIKPANIVKVLEGNYSKSQQNTTTSNLTYSGYNKL